MEPKTTILCISNDGMEKGNVSCDTNEILEEPYSTKIKVLVLQSVLLCVKRLILRVSFESRDRIIRDRIRQAH